MAFGHWMEVVEGDTRLRMGPIERDDAVRYVAADANFGLQSYEVGRYLAMNTAPTPQGEQEWWDNASKDTNTIHWGLYVPDGESWKLVGTTTLHIQGSRRTQAESGFLLFDRAYWRQRIASTAHLARTLFAFRELDLLAITSAAYVPNVGSNRALQGVGYVQTGMRYAESFVDGKPVDSVQYLLPNPIEEAWNYFWRRPDDEIPVEFRDARPTARKTLERAATAVSFL